MKRVSVYVKGNRASTAYYRIYQYLDNIEGVECKYRMMMSSYVHDKYMPVSKQSVWVKVMVYVHIYFRMLMALLCDVVKVPDVIVVHRRIISRFMPLSYKLLLLFLKFRKVRFIWDFDDNITESGEVSKATFEFYSNLSDVIIVTHDYLQDMIPVEFREKVWIMPTTDGDMYMSFKSGKLNDCRLSDFEKEIRLVWVATSSNLQYLNDIVPVLDSTAEKLLKKGQVLKLSVVCDAGLKHECKNLVVENIKWTREKAIAAMKSGHIGVMPLADNAFTKGKGGFKLVQYMSVGLPSIGSNVGYNMFVLADGAGMLVEDNAGWENAIIKLSDKKTWSKYSQNAYNRWLQNFSYINNFERWQQVINGF